MPKLSTTLFSTPLLKFTKRIESAAAYLQGKGYGAGTIGQENKLVHELLQKSPELAIDIGGNVGNYSAEIRKLNPQVEIHIFEPSLTNIEKLKSRFANDKKISVLPLAVADHTGSATLFSNEPGSGLGSLTQRRLDHFNIDFNIQEDINIIRFEDYWNNNLNNRNLDIVKMDIEGHELAALKGFGKAIFATNVLQFEFGGCNIDTRTYFQDFWYFFKEHNFNLFRITPLGLEPIKVYREIDEFFTTTNYIALNKNNSN